MIAALSIRWILPIERAATRRMSSGRGQEVRDLLSARITSDGCAEVKEKKTPTIRSIVVTLLQEIRIWTDGGRLRMGGTSTTSRTNVVVLGDRIGGAGLDGRRADHFVDDGAIYGRVLLVVDQICLAHVYKSVHHVYASSSDPSAHLRNGFPLGHPPAPLA